MPSRRSPQTPLSALALSARHLTIYHLTIIIIIIIIIITSSGAIIIIIITCPSAPSSLRQPKLVKDGRLVLVKDGLGSALPREADGRQAERPRRRERRGT